MSAIHETPDASARPVLVWDLPTRVFHWTLVTCFAAAFLTGEPDRFRDLHVYFGYVVLGLIAFRIFWGFAGSRYARFKSFPYGPRAAMRYGMELLGSQAARHIGHNPAGSFAIYLLLSLGVVLCVTGIVVYGAEEAQGPLRWLAHRSLGDSIKEVHEAVAWSMLMLVAIHVGGVVVESLLHGENLAKAMVTGRKVADASAGIASGHPWIAAAILACAAGSALWLIHWRLVTIPGLEKLPYVGRQLPDNKAWREACGSCHGVFHPSLLPARSWTAILAKPDDHFGIAWTFDAKTLGEIRAFLQQNAGEAEITEAAYRIHRSIPADATPLRITETPFWVEKHERIGEATWASAEVGSKSNCQACHRDAVYGTYDDAAIRLPARGGSKR